MGRRMGAWARGHMEPGPEGPERRGHDGGKGRQEQGEVGREDKEDPSQGKEEKGRPKERTNTDGDSDAKPGAARGQEDGGRKKEEGSQGEHAQEHAMMRGGDRKHARSTQRARAPVNRSQEAQDAAHTPPLTTRAHR